MCLFERYTFDFETIEDYLMYRASYYVMIFLLITPFVIKYK
jgi:hypothetical protein